MFQLPAKIMKVLKKLPAAPGIYLFYNSKKELIYVGKATSLKSRVKSYFVGQKTSRPIEEFISEVVNINWEMTDSVLEAVILEALTIKKYKPKYNVLGKDDRSWNYFVLTRDKYPKFLALRQHEYSVMSKEAKKKLSTVFGPYPGLNTKAAMKILRQLFRYSTCKPPVILSDPDVKSGESKNPLGKASRNARGSLHSGRDDNKKPCLYYQMQQCLGICTGEITPLEYKSKVIVPLKIFLRGKKKKVIKEFEKQMSLAAKAENFEEAGRLRDQLKGLKKIQDIAILNKSFFEEYKTTNLQLQITRIEGYDISNIGSSNKVGSMVVFDNAGPIKSAYRKFIVKTVKGQSDVDSVKEVLRRRLNHPEWPLPDVILIDGGRVQVNAAKSVLKNLGSVHPPPVLGIAKGAARKRNDIILGSKDVRFVEWVYNNKWLLIQVRDEAHRFAVKFHRQQRAKSFKK